MTDTPESPYSFEQMFAEMNTPEANLKFERYCRYKREVLYAGLENLNTGFDSPGVQHFSPAEFLIVIDRCEALGVGIIGIEVFTTDVEPPCRAMLEEIEISPEPGFDWARRLITKYMETRAITVCATFHVPDAILQSEINLEGEKKKMKRREPPKRRNRP